jgi:Schlafen, AlbA_2
VPLFTTPLSHVTYDQVLEFCRTFAEGPRVEYKTEAVNIPKVVSSFANTVGGVWVIGVDTDKTTNRPILPPVGVKREPGIEEQITQSALTGIYPGITPDVRVVDIPDQADRVLVVVRVPESIEAPHAIQNATRVYIRNASTTAAVELADIDRIDYLLTRRRDTAGRRERLIERAAARSPYADEKRVRVVVSPMFPRGTLFSRDELHERADRLKHMPVRHVTDFRLVHEAVSTLRTADARFYFECSVDGVVFYEKPGRGRGLGDIKYVMLPELLLPLAVTLITASALLSDRLTNMLVRYELYGWQGTAFLPLAPPQPLDPDLAARDGQCVDPRVTVDTTAVAGDLAERSRIMVQVLTDVLWAFNYRSPDIGKMVYVTARDSQLF